MDDYTVALIGDLLDKVANGKMECSYRGHILTIGQARILWHDSPKEFAYEAVFYVSPWLD